MAALGTNLKKEITDKILATFPGSFINDKEIRICGIEEGKEIQIKVTLTCAKQNIENGGSGGSIGVTVTPTQNVVAPTEPSAAEKENISTLLSKLGL
jgi:hypothetical protein